MVKDAIELKEKIEIVFNQEFHNRYDKNISYRFVHLINQLINEPILNATPNINFVVIPAPREYILEFPSMETLKKLFISIELNTFLKREFIEILKLKIEQDEGVRHYNGVYPTVYDLSDLAFATLVYINEIDKALNSFSIRIMRNINRYSCLEFINDVLIYNYHHFTSRQLKLLKKIVYHDKIFSYNELNRTIIKKIDKILFDNFNKELEGINFEINQDAQKVIEKIEYYNMGADLVKALQEIDTFIYLPEKTINSGMINNLRNIIATIVKKISDKIAEKIREPIPTKDPDNPNKKEMGLRRDYIKKHLQLTTDDDKFIDAFVDVLHQEGGHSFISEKEYFRLARNITIIINSFLLSKLDKFMEKIGIQNLKV